MASALIGVTGRKRSGKDTFAARLVEAHGFTRLAFADALKATLLDLDPLVVVQQDEYGILLGNPCLPYGHAYTPRLSHLIELAGGWERAKEFREVRRLLQEHGVAIREHVSPLVWVEAVVRKMLAIPGPVVITDVRFPNEADLIQDAGGLLVRVVRPGLDSTDLHVSETALDDRYADLTVVNSQTIEDLHDLADAAALRVLL